MRFADIEPLEVENGMVMVGPIEVAWDSIPNAPLFLALGSETTVG